MWTNSEPVFKIVELIISVFAPILILFVLTKRIESIKYEAAKKYKWESKWSDSFYDKFKDYTDNVSEFISNLELLRIKIRDNAQNDSDGILLQKRLTQLVKDIFSKGINLQLLSSTLFGENNEINNSIDKILKMISSFSNKREGNVHDIYKELKNLNILTGKAFNHNLIK